VEHSRTSLMLTALSDLEMLFLSFPKPCWSQLMLRSHLRNLCHVYLVNFHLGSLSLNPSYGHSKYHSISIFHPLSKAVPALLKVHSYLTLRF